MMRNFHAARALAALALLAAAALWPAGHARALPASAAAANTASAPTAHTHGAAPRQGKPAAAPVHLVDINSASRKELMTLPGISAADADRIIAGRPYLTKTELVTKQVLPTGPYLTLRKQIVAMQKPKKAAKSS